MSRGENYQSAAPEPIEWRVGSPGVTVRGLVWLGTRLPVLFVHEPGSGNDLDCWKSLPELVSRAGHTVIAFDLPGHGLSEGDTGKANASAAIEHVSTYMFEVFGRTLAVVTEGIGNQLLPPNPLAALILLSPLDDTGAQTTGPKLVFTGSEDPDARAAADRYLRSSRGWTLVSSFGTSAQGSALLETDHAPKITAQLLSFLRDYS